VKLHSVAVLDIPQTHDIYTYSLTYFIPQRTPYKVLAEAEGTVFILHAMTWYQMAEWSTSHIGHSTLAKRVPSSH